MKVKHVVFGRILVMAEFSIKENRVIVVDAESRVVDEEKVMG